jgi:hypothetical protein
MEDNTIKTYGEADIKLPAFLTLEVAVGTLPPGIESAVPTE